MEIDGYYLNVAKDEYGVAPDLIEYGIVSKELGIEAPEGSTEFKTEAEMNEAVKAAEVENEAAIQKMINAADDPRTNSGLEGLDLMKFDVTQMTQEEFVEYYKKADSVDLAKDLGIASSGNEKTIVARIYEKIGL